MCVAATPFVSSLKLQKGMSSPGSLHEVTDPRKGGGDSRILESSNTRDKWGWRPSLDVARKAMPGDEFYEMLNGR
jgi:hypothetical protein